MDDSELVRSEVHRSLDDVTATSVGRRLLGAINLMENYTRGVVADAIVADAIGGEMVGRGYGSWDVERGDLKIEVKASGDIQAWQQREKSTPEFSIARSTGWNRSADGVYVVDPVSARRCNVYVFAHHSGVRPEDPNEWRFYVVPTARVDSTCGSQKRITLSSLKRRLQPVICEVSDLAAAIGGFDEPAVASR